MKFYNTLTKKIEEFIPNNEDSVKMYTCGPTVYHYAHIGNLRTYISEDILEKSLNYLGYNVKRCMNITDVGHMVGDGDSGEDKIAVASRREHKSSLEIAKFYTEAFKEDCESLNIKWPEIVSNATDNILYAMRQYIDSEYQSDPVKTRSSLQIVCLNNYLDGSMNAGRKKLIDAGIDVDS